MRPTLAVGWDVGGWRGRKQAVAVLHVTNESQRWIGPATTFDLAALNRAGGSPLDLIRIAWPSVPDETLDRYRVVLAIDAPLGFPIAFRQLITGNGYPDIDFGPEIANPFAYRETERWVFRTFGKKPLSAPFDKLGNNATAAIYHARRWRNSAGFVVAPFDADDGNTHVIIEVYPALVKNRATGRSIPELEPLMPLDLPPSTDAYDAAMCALLAGCYAGYIDREDGELIRLQGPPDSVDPRVIAVEGWIYALPPALVSLP